MWKSSWIHLWHASTVLYIGLHTNTGNQTLRQTAMCTGKETAKHKQTEEENEAKKQSLSVLKTVMRKYIVRRLFFVYLAVIITSANLLGCFVIITRSRNTTNIHYMYATTMSNHM